MISATRPAFASCGKTLHTFSEHAPKLAARSATAALFNVRRDGHATAVVTPTAFVFIERLE